jgi:predicted transcriptional regulator
MPTTIQISDNVKSVLDKMKMIKRETYNEIIERMIEDDLELNEKTKKELEERRKSKDFISHADVKKRFGL